MARSDADDDYTRFNTMMAVSEPPQYEGTFPLHNDCNSYTRTLTTPFCCSVSLSLFFAILSSLSTTVYLFPLVSPLLSSHAPPLICSPPLLAASALLSPPLLSSPVPSHAYSLPFLQAWLQSDSKRFSRPRAPSAAPACPRSSRRAPW